jgi:hypothetical protein
LAEIDFRRILIRVRTDIGIGDIAFYENKEGALHFIDPKGESHLADQATFNACAASQKWLPIEILKFEQSYEDEAGSGSDTRSQSSSPRELEEHDPADGTEWE